MAPLIRRARWPAGSLALAVRYPVAPVYSPVCHVASRFGPAIGRASLLQSEHPEQVAPGRPVMSRLEKFVEPPARFGQQIPCLVEER